jgi:hypothetical protein
MRSSGPLRLSGYCGGRCWRLAWQRDAERPRAEGQAAAARRAAAARAAVRRRPRARPPERRGPREGARGRPGPAGRRTTAGDGRHPVAAGRNRAPAAAAGRNRAPAAAPGRNGAPAAAAGRNRAPAAAPGRNGAPAAAAGRNRAPAAAAGKNRAPAEAARAAMAQPAKARGAPRGLRLPIGRAGPHAHRPAMGRAEPHGRPRATVRARPRGHLVPARLPDGAPRPSAETDHGARVRAQPRKAAASSGGREDDRPRAGSGEGLAPIDTGPGMRRRRVRLVREAATGRRNDRGLPGPVSALEPGRIRLAAAVPGFPPQTATARGTSGGRADPAFRTRSPPSNSTLRHGPSCTACRTT